MDLQLKGKLALVSGSTAGIGYAIAHTLAREGAGVVVTGRSQAAVDETVGRIRAETQGTALGYAGDLSQPDVAQEVVRRHAGIGILVNNIIFISSESAVQIPTEMIHYGRWRPLSPTWQVRSRRPPRVRPFAWTAGSSRAPSDQ